MQVKPLSPQACPATLVEVYHDGPESAILPPYAEKLVAGATTNVATLAMLLAPTMAVAAGVVAWIMAFVIVPCSGYTLYTS